MQWKDMQTLVSAPGAAVDEKRCVEAFPLLEGLKNAPGDPVYHGEGSVYIHTFMVMDALVNDPRYALLGQSDRETVFFATLLHDIAKLRTTVVEGGRVSNPGHSAKGALDARIMLWEAGAPITQREAICRMIVHHQIPFHAINGNRQGDSAEFIVRSLSWQVDLHLLCMLARADILGRICPDVPAVLDNIELFRLLAQEEGCYRAPRSFASADTALRYFRGAQVHPDFALHESPGSEVIVVCGLPASGKNHWVARHHGSLPVVSYDDARTELNLAYGKNEGAVAHFAAEKAKSLLRTKSPFVFNATHLSKQLRGKSVDLCLSYGARVNLVHLEASKKTLLARNAARDSTLTNAKLLGMLSHWEAPTPVEAHSLQMLSNE